MNIESLHTLFCPKCGWHGNDYDCSRLTIKEMQMIGIADQHGFLLPRYQSWDFRYCPKCLYTKLLLFNQKEYANAIMGISYNIDEETKKYLNREKKC
jgi:hypothetical protein